LKVPARSVAAIHKNKTIPKIEILESSYNYRRGLFLHSFTFQPKVRISLSAMRLAFGAIKNTLEIMQQSCIATLQINV